MGEEFQGGVCGGTWWNSTHNIFSGSLSSPCSVAQLGGGSFDMANFGWQNEVIKEKFNNNNNNSVFDNLIFPNQVDSFLDSLGFGLSPTSSTTVWNHHQNMICNSGSSEGNFLQDNLNDSSKLNSYGLRENSSNITVSSNFYNNTNNNDSNVDNQQGASPPMAMTALSNSSGDSSTITTEGGDLRTSFPMNSSASYLIQSLFDDSDVCQVLEPESLTHSHQFIDPSNYGSLDTRSEIISSNSWVKSRPDNTITQPSIPSKLQLLHSNNNKLQDEINALVNGGHGQVLSGQYSPTTLGNIQASLLNSLQSRSRGPTSSSNSKSHSYATKVNSEDRRDLNNNSSSNDQPLAKRPRIETQSPMPTFKVRKEKLGDRITALQQLVSPFGKTDTASVLHEAIEYIKFLHDQVNVLSTPYLKSGAQMQQQGCEKLKENEEGKQDLRSRGLCLVPISSTYPVAQETPVDFWTPTFGGPTFR